MEAAVDHHDDLEALHQELKREIEAQKAKSAKTPLNLQNQKGKNVEKALDVPDLLEYAHIWEPRPTTEAQEEQAEPAEEQAEFAGERNLDAHGIFVRRLLKSAWRFWKEESFDDCFHICTKIVATPQASDFHKAMAHYMLSHGEDEYVSHAEKAVDLLDNLYTVRPGSSWLGLREPSTAELEALQKYRAVAHKALSEAKADSEATEKKYEEMHVRFVKFHGRDPTDDELLQAHIDQYKDEMEEDMDRHGAEIFVD